MHIRIYWTNKTIEDIRDVLSITAHSGHYYISLLDGRDIKVEYEPVGEIHVRPK